MTKRTIAFTIIGFVAGMAVTWGVRSQAVAEPAAAPTSTVISTTAPTEPAVETIEYHVAPHETVIGSTAIVPVEAVADDDSYNFTFDVVSLAPQAEAVALAAALEQPLDPEHTAAIFPIEWILETSGGAIEGTIPRPGVNVVRFPVEEGFAEESVEAVIISRYLIAAPIDAAFTLSAARPHLDLYPGVAIDLIQVSDHIESSIVQVEVTSDVTVAIDSFFIIGEGHGWRSSVRESEGGPRWNLAWIGTDLPTEIPLKIVGTAWLEGTGPVVVDREGVQ
jgi:hypothetical protein